MNLLKKILVSAIAGVSIAGCFAPTSLAKADNSASETPEVTDAEIDNYIKNASLESKIGQMFVSRTPQKAGQAEYDVNKYNLGGLIVYDADLKGLTQDQFKAKMARFQSTAQVPLLIGIDQEGGLVSRLTHSGLIAQNGDQFAFPRQQFENAEKAKPGSGMAAVVNFAKENATLLRSLGINWNYAPDADYSNQTEGFIYKRTFGGGSYEATANYIRKVVPAWQHDGLVASTLKHFPGYGDAADTHTGFAVRDDSKEDIETKDMSPFKAGVEAGADSVMVTHVIYSKIDPVYPASLSKAIIEMIRKDCNFNGVVVTDALEMDAIKDFAKEHGNEPIDVLAVKAGNDMIMATDYATGIPEIAKAVKANEISESQINDSVKRILKMKNKLHLLTSNDLNGNRKPVTPDNPDQPVNPDNPETGTKNFKLNDITYDKENTLAKISGTIPDSAVEGSMTMSFTNTKTNKVITTVVVGGKGEFSTTIPVTDEDQTIKVSSNDASYKSQTVIVKGKKSGSIVNPAFPTNPVVPIIPAATSSEPIAQENSKTAKSKHKVAHPVTIKIINRKKATKTVMHRAKVYNKNGKKVAIKQTYQKISVLAKVRIKGKAYYQIGNNKYILVSNVDGIVRKLSKNSYIYNNKGLRLGKEVRLKNTKIRTYGAKVIIKDKSYYRISKNKYIKAVNFRK